ncbi:MAG TPA: hypothetical protein VMT16_16885 [Thermoanaerobaculia bacterium]|nr:hypothetical protein [Thermoanaerobaculia bacterium]
MRRAHAGRLVLFLLLVIPLPAAGQDLAPFLRAQLRMERELLEDALRRYAEVRAREQQAADRRRELARRLDDLLTEEGPLGEIEDLDAALSLARQISEQSAVQAGALRLQVVDHRRRVELLRELLGEEVAVESPADPITGSWTVRVLPYDQQGVFDLTLDGALVHGSYRLDGEYRGSLRGTFVGRTVRLERIDSEAGFDMVYEAVLAPGGERLDGSWRATLLNAAGPAGGSWLAVRQAPRANEGSE